MKRKKKAFTPKINTYITKENKMAKKSKRIAKAIGAGLAAYGLSKMMGKELPVSGKDSEVGAVLSKKVSPTAVSTYDEAGMKESAMMDKIKPARTTGYKPSDAMMKRRQAVSDFEEKRRKTGIKSGFEFMSFSKGSKDVVKGKNNPGNIFIELKTPLLKPSKKSSGGMSVMARGCKLGRKKPTKLY